MVNGVAHDQAQDRWKWLAVLAGAISIPSIFESIVTYVEWFRLGFIEPMNSLKSAIRSALYWVPISLPAFWIEYIFFGIIMLRSALLITLSDIRRSYGLFALFLIAPFVVAFWPIVLFWTIASLSPPSQFHGSYGSHAVDQVFRTKIRAVASSVFSLFFASIFFGFAIVLSLSDALHKIGWI